MATPEPDRIAIISVDFQDYKAFRKYYVSLHHMNILVGLNNCGKSTIIGAFRVLAMALRRARSKEPEPMVIERFGMVHGYRLPRDLLPVSVSNIHTDYDDIESIVTFRLSNSNRLVLHFGLDGECSLIPITTGRQVRSRSDLKREFPIAIGVVPVLGAMEEHEDVLEVETVRKSLAKPRAASHFRNYWYHFPEHFDEFAEMVANTWPGVTVGRPERVELTSRRLKMFCYEDRMPRELYWAGYGFQIWCQLLTHIVRASENTILVVDEPEVYLHPDIQHHLLTILREAGPDVLLATHSTEIIGDADASEIIVVDKTHHSAERLRDIEGVQSALDTIGSMHNITLTRLARNRRILFVEGDTDYSILRRFAHKLGLTELAGGDGLTPVRSDGFESHQRISAFAWGLEKTLSGPPIRIAAVFDRDYWCDEELRSIADQLRRAIEFVHIHSRKEIENYLLIPSALQRTLEAAVHDRIRRTGEDPPPTPRVADLLGEITEAMRADALGQYIAKRAEFMKHSGQDQATINRETIRAFEMKWSDLDTRMEIVPGKAVLPALRARIQTTCGVTLTDTRIIDNIHRSEVPPDLLEFLKRLEDYRCS